MGRHAGRPWLPDPIIKEHFKDIARRDKWSRTLITLDGRLKVELIVLKLTGKARELYGKYAVVYDERVIPGYQYGRDVVGLIFYLRHKYRMSYDEIIDHLKQFNINIDKSRVSRLLRLGEVAFMKKSLEKTLEELKRRGNAILVIDGAQPEKGQPAVWFALEVTTGKPLLVRVLDSQDTDSIVRFLKEVRGILDDVKVKAVVSDGQREIREAVKKVFPEAEHQLCQFHYLKNVARRIIELDRKLAKNLRREVRRLKEFRDGRKLASRGFKKRSLS
ncbi:MAG TPA: hypothetical protein ENG55_00840 [Candidatus Omnitrophica bacterium]|nr:hypothetical protein [Candidatus Omnitrophota bacterium]